MYSQNRLAEIYYLSAYSCWRHHHQSSDGSPWTLGCKNNKNIMLCQDDSLSYCCYITTVIVHDFFQCTLLYIQCTTVLTLLSPSWWLWAWTPSPRQFAEEPNLWQLPIQASRLDAMPPVHHFLADWSCSPQMSSRQTSPFQGRVAGTYQIGWPAVQKQGREHVMCMCFQSGKLRIYDN